MNKPWYKRWYNIASIVFVVFCLLLLATLGSNVVEMPARASSSQGQTEESTPVREADGLIVDSEESDGVLEENIEEEASTNETVDTPVVQQPYKQSEQNYQQEVPAQRNTSQSSQPSSQSQPAEDNSASGCAIKGNVNKKGEKIYHVPGSTYYKRTVVDPTNGDKWFCSVQEAESAGFRAPKR